MEEVKGLSTLIEVISRGENTRNLPQYFEKWSIYYYICTRRQVNIDVETYYKLVRA
jgi:hypothetical protein